MAYTDQKLPHKMLGVFLLVVVVGMAIRYFVAGGFIEYYSPDKRLENDIAAELEKQPGGAMLLARLEADFPDRHDDLLETLTRAAKADGPPDRIGKAANQWIAGFFANHENDFKAAPIESLDKVIDLEAKMLATMQSDYPEICTDYAYGVPQKMALPEDIRTVSDTIMDARFAAIKAGRVDQQMRLALTPPDFEALNKTLVAQGTNAEQLAYIDGSSDGIDLSDEEACGAAVNLVSAVRAQPEYQRALLIGAYVVGR